MTRFLAPLFATLLLAACGPADTPAGPEPQTVAAATPPEASAVPTLDADYPPITVYKTPTCGCCSMWVDHLKASGFTVETVDMPNLSEVKARYGVAPEMQSCHTGVVDGYVVEGHVPADDIKRLLAERPEARGIAVPGMPIGSPGMEVPGQAAQPYDVMLLTDGAPEVFASH